MQFSFWRWLIFFQSLENRMKHRRGRQIDSAFRNTKMLLSFLLWSLWSVWRLTERTATQNNFLQTNLALLFSAKEKNTHNHSSTHSYTQRLEERRGRVRAEGGQWETETNTDLQVDGRSPRTVCYSTHSEAARTEDTGTWTQRERTRQALLSQKERERLTFSFCSSKRCVRFDLMV